MATAKTDKTEDGACAEMRAIQEVAHAVTPRPQRPVRFLVPFPPGGSTDVAARALADKMSAGLGQQVLVENRGGGGGTVGAAAVARAEPDGYTLLAHSSAHVTTPAIYPNAPYDTANDFAAVAAFGSSPNVTVVAPEKGIKTLQQLVDAAKAKPGSITFGAAGVGSATHISAEILRFSAGFEALMVPFRGMPEILTEIMAGRATSRARPSPPRCRSSARASSWRSP